MVTGSTLVALGDRNHEPQVVAHEGGAGRLAVRDLVLGCGERRRWGRAQGSAGVGTGAHRLDQGRLNIMSQHRMIGEGGDGVLQGVKRHDAPPAAGRKVCPPHCGRAARWER